MKKQPMYRGEIEITATDTVTGATRHLTQHNVIVDLLEYMHRSTLWSECDLYVSPNRIASAAKSYSLVTGGTRYTTRQDAYSAPTINRHLEDWYQEETFRFDATGTANPINSLSFCSGIYTTRKVMASISLPETFTQGPSELLSVKYRFILATTGMSERAAFLMASYFRLTFTSPGTQNFKETVMTGYLHPGAADGIIYFNGPVLAGSPYTGGNLSISGNTHTLTKTEEVGSYLSGIASTFRLSDLDSESNYYGWAPFRLRPLLTPEYSRMVPNYPFGPLFNHSATATHNFEDVDNLASGSGYPVITGAAGGVEYAMPMMFIEPLRINIRKSGNVGAATFDLTYEPISGAGLTPNSNTPRDTLMYIYGPRENNHNDDYDLISDHSSLKDTTLRPVGEATFEYNSEWIVGTDFRDGQLALAFTNTLDYSRVIGFDGLTTPALPNALCKELEPHMLSRNPDGDLFFHSVDGYIRINDPLGTPSIAVKTLASIGVTDDIITLCATSVGLYVLTPTQCAYSVDDGDTWTVSTLSGNIGTKGWVVGGNPQAPSKVVCGGLNIPVSFLDMDTGVRSPASSQFNSVLGFAGYYDENSGKYFCIWRTRYTNVVNSIVVKWGEQDTRTAAYSPDTPLSYNTEGLGYARFTRDSTYTARIIYFSSSDEGEMYSHCEDGIRTVSPVHMSTTEVRYTAANELAVNFLAHEYDIRDGVPSFHYNKLGYPDAYNRTYRYFSVGDPAPLPETKANALSELDCIFSKTTRQVNGNWVDWMNADIAPIAPSKALVSVDRSGFDSDSNYFNTGARLDFTGSMITVPMDETGTGFTLLATATSSARITGTFSSDWRNTVNNVESPLECLFSLGSFQSGQSVSLLTGGYNNQVTLLVTDGGVTTETTLGAKSTGVANRYGLTVSADYTTVTVYRDGSLLGAAVTLASPLDLTGYTLYQVGGLVGVESLGAGFKGTISDVIVYDVAVSPAQITEDNSNRTEVISTLGSAVVTRLPLTGTYNEAAVTTATDANLPNGVSIRFQDGAAGTSYVRGDNYFAVRAYGGLVKDNATTLSLVSCTGMIARQIDECSSYITGTNVLPPATDSLETFPMLFTQTRYAYTHNHGGNPAVASTSASAGAVGLTGAYEFSWEEYTPDTDGEVHLSARSGSDGGSNRRKGLFYVVFAGNTVSWNSKAGDTTTITHTRKIGDQWRLVGSTDTGQAELHYRPLGGSWSKLGDTYTATVPSRLYVSVASITANYFVIGGAEGQCNYPTNVLLVGNKATSTGAYSPSFRGLGDRAEVQAACKVYVDGVRQTLFFANNTNVGSTVSGDGVPDPDLDPPLGTVRVHPDVGMLVFNSSLAGSTVEISGFTTMDDGIITLNGGGTEEGPFIG